ncbi:MAG: gliding motility-associated C-terminal domain-containing protein [Spirosomataceae bacterium]
MAQQLYGGYTVKVKDATCAATAIAVPITQNAYPVVDAGKDVQTIVETGVAMSATATGAVTYRWEPVTGVDQPSVLNPVINPSETTTYTLTAISAVGCEATDQVIVNVVLDLDIPNAFSPNDDGVNDAWLIKGIEQYPDCVVDIFDRWGSKIFSSQGYQTPWNGKRQHESMPMATYYYVINLNVPDRAPVHGTIIIVK